MRMMEVAWDNIINTENTDEDTNLVVESEDVIINADDIKVEQLLDRSKHVKHLHNWISEIILH